MAKRKKYFHPKRGASQIDVRSGPCQIIKRLPATHGEFQYVIRSAYEEHERVATESELTRV